MKFTMNKFHYDKGNDILYYTIGDKNNSYGDEDPDNIVVLRDIDTNKITGITVLNFKKMCQLQDDRINILSQYFSVNDLLKVLK